MIRVFITTIMNYASSFDLFGQRVELLVDKQKMVKSRFGALITIAIITVSCLLFVTNVLSAINLENLTMISSVQVSSARQIINKNESNFYAFNNDNYYAYFSYYVFLPNGTLLNMDQLGRYVQQSFWYFDIDSVLSPINSDKCQLAQKDKFLLLSEDEIQKDINKTSRSFCMQDSVSMGYSANIPSQTVVTTGISYRLTICQNTTDNPNKCATYEEIKQILPYMTIQASIPKTCFDFNDPNNARKRTYDNSFYSADIDNKKLYSIYLIPIYLKTDHGLIHEDYELDAIDFNVDSINFDLSKRQDEVFFEYDFLLGYNKQTYLRKNTKLTDILANLGGIVNLLFIAGKILCLTYNGILLKHHLINYTFSNLQVEKKVKRNEETIELNTAFPFSFIRHLIPPIFKKGIYENALSNIYEYLDIELIIKRLQDVDRLKLILMNENQRKMFELIPKPGLGKKEFQKQLTLENIRSSKKKMSKIDLKTIFANEEDPLSMRIWEMLDPDIKNEIVVGKNLLNYAKSQKFTTIEINHIGQGLKLIICHLNYKFIDGQNFKIKDEMEMVDLVIPDERVKNQK